MILSVVFFIFSLAMILVAAELFTNGIEAFGIKFSLSQAVVGSVLAAVGTALPETVLPLVAIFFFGDATAKEIGVGAILGAPFMLSTLGFLLVSLTVLLTFLGKKRPFEVRVEPHSMRRDVGFFLVMYAAAAFIPLATGGRFNRLLAALLFAGYLYYLHRTVQSESANMEDFGGLYVNRLLARMEITQADERDVSTWLIVSQIAGTLALMVLGANMFVSNLKQISLSLGMSPLLFALLLAPIATELPEKFNSVTWTMKGKDTLALGNITGAMVFQSTFPVSVGLLFTRWELTGMALLSAVIALLSALAVYVNLVLRKKLSPYSLLFGGMLYLVYLVVLLSRHGS